MGEIRLDGASWKTSDDFYQAYFRAIAAPSWHGRNLDAIWDSLTGGDLNERNPPMHVHISGVCTMDREVRQLVKCFATLIEEAAAEGSPVAIELED